jgi:hypothetical protein
MKLCILAVVLAFGCTSSKESSSAEASRARPTVTDPLGFCDRARMVITGRRKCFPEDTSIKMALDGIAKLQASAPADPDKRRHVAAECAVMLDGMMRVEQPKDCPLDVTDDERTELSAFLAAWYGERTAAPKTGDATTDTAVTKLAGHRDAACACKDTACARTAATELESGLAALPSETPAAARDAAAKMLDEARRCKQKLAFAPTP